MQTNRQLIEALPDKERAARRAMYSDAEWDGLWELNAFPFQLPPHGEWESWTVIGGKGVGKTTAGMKWIQEKLAAAESAETLLSIHHWHNEINRLVNTIYDGLNRIPGYEFSQLDGGGRYAIRNLNAGTRLDMIPDNRPSALRGLDPAYVWGDDIDDAGGLRREFPRAKQFCFTEPTRLDPLTIVTRA